MAIFPLPVAVVKEIPIDPENANQLFEVVLDGVTFRLLYRFNSRDLTWYLDVFSASDVLLRAGIRVVDDWTSFLRWADFAVRPGGEILNIARGVAASAPGFGELGVDVIATYHGDS